MLFPTGKNHHTSYPFGLHATLPLPWNYYSIGDTFFVQSNSCKRGLVPKGSCCAECMALAKNDIFDAIFDQIRHGIHPNTPLIYQPIGGLIAVARQKTDHIQSLKLRQLADSRKLFWESGNARRPQTMGYGCSEWPCGSGCSTDTSCTQS